MIQAIVCKPISHILSLWRLNENCYAYRRSLWGVAGVQTSPLCIFGPHHFLILLNNMILCEFTYFYSSRRIDEIYGSVLDFVEILSFVINYYFVSF